MCLIFLCRHGILMTGKRIKLICILSWLFTYLVSLILFMIPAGGTETNYKYHCILTNFISEKVFNFTYIPVFMLSILLMLIIYGRIICLLQSRDSQMSSMTGVNNRTSDASGNVTKLAIFVIGL